MSLTDTFIRNVKPVSSPRKYFDGEGLFLYVPPNGSKLWRMSYRFDGKTKLLSFGKYPTVGLRDARARKEEAKVMLDKGIDPSEQKKKQKEERRAEGLYVKNGGKEFQGSHSDEVFFSLSAEHADTQAVVFKIPEAVRSSLDQFHFPMEAFGYPVVFREAEHPGDLLLPQLQRAPKGTHSLEWALAKLVYAG